MMETRGGGGDRAHEWVRPPASTNAHAAREGVCMRLVAPSQHLLLLLFFWCIEA